MCGIIQKVGQTNRGAEKIENSFRNLLYIVVNLGRIL